MAINISAVVLLSILAIIFVQKGGLKTGHAIVCILLGFYLASSSIAPTINDVTKNVAQMISEINF
ncbi:hypothetical protein [Streptomyces lunaelactis]|uniref:hypothetical protein n=1 Tax=Streptomyces lunaelactis TaxID=1535768 RepID=UPI00158475F5|nr:hypothetical protein [Streptomyces lunaelactis]NUK18129.1 hypothetical protein [Streptomyces lunaelactis]